MDRVARQLECLFEIIFALEWMLFAPFAFLGLELLADAMIFIAAVLGGLSIEEAQERYNHKFGDIIKKWWDTLVKKFKNLC